MSLIKSLKLGRGWDIVGWGYIFRVFFVFLMGVGFFFFLVKDF